MAESKQQERTTLPSTEIGTDIAIDTGNSISTLPPSLQLLLNEGMYTRVKQLGMLMSNASGFTPKHLIGKGEACFAVITCALDWRLNPHFVAKHTYQTPGGQIGFTGALTQSILEKSGRFIGAPKFEHRGDWNKLAGKFKKATSARGNEYIQPAWTEQDAIGLGVIVRWQVRGEPEPRVWPGDDEPFWLTQCYPLNSPLWATDPKTQICYLAIRRFANLAAPGMLGAAGFDPEDMIDASDMARDITPPPPRPTREQFTAEGERKEPYIVMAANGDEEGSFYDPDQAYDRLVEVLQSAATAGINALDAACENNVVLVNRWTGENLGSLVTAIDDILGDLRGELQATAAQNTERAEADDPDGKPPEAGAADVAVDGAGTSSEAETRQSAPASAQPDGPVRQETRATAVSDAEAGANPAPQLSGPVVDVDQRCREAAAKGRKALDTLWIKLPAEDKALVRVMRPDYYDIADQVK